MKTTRLGSFLHLQKHVPNCSLVFPCKQRGAGQAPHPPEWDTHGPRGQGGSRSPMPSPPTLGATRMQTGTTTDSQVLPVKAKGRAETGAQPGPPSPSSAQRAASCLRELLQRRRSRHFRPHRATLSKLLILEVKSGNVSVLSPNYTRHTPVTDTSAIGPGDTVRTLLAPAPRQGLQGWA